MEWMQGMQQPLLYQLWPLCQNHYYQFIPSTWKWGQSFQHVGRNGKQHDTTAGWVDGHAGHGNAKHGEFILYFVFLKLVFFREGWVVGCQWTIPSYLQCGAACRAGPWGQWEAEEWWRCVLSILKKGMVCPWARVNIDYVTYVDILLCLVRSAEQSCRCLGKDLVSWAWGAKVNICIGYQFWFVDLSLGWGAVFLAPIERGGRYVGVWSFCLRCPSRR